MNEASLLSGIPLEDGVLNPRYFSQAAERLGLASKVARKSIESINLSLLPAVLLLKNNRSCVLVSINQKEAEVIFPEFPTVTSKLSLERLLEIYNGYVIYVRPEYTNNLAKQNPFASSEKGHWFWSIIGQNKRLYRDIVIAAIFINIIALAMPMFVMNVYDRVVPNNSFSTLGVLSVGILSLLVIDYALKLLRSWFVDLAASRADIRLSSRILNHAMSISLAHKPANSSSLTSLVQSFEAVRSFISSLTITALADLPFLMLFILVVSFISWPLAIPIIVGSFLIILYSLIVQPRIKKMSDSSMELHNQRSTLLQDGMGNLETIKSFKYSKQCAISLGKAHYSYS